MVRRVLPICHTVLLSCCCRGSQALGAAGVSAKAARVCSHATRTRWCERRPDGQSPEHSLLRRPAVPGMALLVGVVVIWVASSELTQYIFTDAGYEKPFFLTYFNATSFALYLLAFAWREKWRSQWRSLGWRRIVAELRPCRLRSGGAARVTDTELLLQRETSSTSGEAPQEAHMLLAVRRSTGSVNHTVWHLSCAGRSALVLTANLACLTPRMGISMRFCSAAPSNMLLPLHRSCE